MKGGCWILPRKPRTPSPTVVNITVLGRKVVMMMALVGRVVREIDSLEYDDLSRSSRNFPASSQEDFLYFNLGPY